MAGRPPDGLSGLSAEEKEKEKTPTEMEVEDDAGPSEIPAADAEPAVVPVKTEEVEENVNRVRYKIVEVLVDEPGQPVNQGALAEEETPVATEEVEAVVEPKPEPVEPVLPPVIKPWTEDTRKELKITTRKNEAGKEVIVKPTNKKNLLWLTNTCTV
jgi:hypothetical protein